MEATRAGDVAAEAERIFKHLRHTHYQRDPVINPRTGTYDVDCAGFVGYVLETVAPEHLALVSREAQGGLPRAFDYYDFFASPNLPVGWQRIAKLADARCGDVLAWRVHKIKPGEDTGHVCVIARTPDYDADASAWVVHVYDSSDIVHYDDSRDKKGKYHSGVGAGAIRFHVDHAGAPTKFQFGPDDAFHSLPCAIGRLERLEHPATAREHAEHGKTHATKEPERDASRPPDMGAGHRIARSARAGEQLAEGEFAFTTYALAAKGGLLLAPTTLACWGPRQQIPESLGSGSSTYALVGGVVFRNV